MINDKLDYDIYVVGNIPLKITTYAEFVIPNKYDEKLIDEIVRDWLKHNMYDIYVRSTNMIYRILD